MNRTIKKASVKRFYYDSHDQLRRPLAEFLAACNSARRLKTLKGLTPSQCLCKIYSQQTTAVHAQPAPAKARTKQLAEVSARMCQVQGIPGS
jgi:hypothetical protein